MAYQALARKWRPQTLDDVLGQQAVTRTLRNALKSKRIAQSFVFAGPRGCGKTTTARILARALNCAQGPTPTPCGECEACVEIAEGRDMDVLEIDAATHTGVDNVREVIIEGLSIAPARNRYKVFLIDEVHMLSTSSFNALLKSIEEPPPHVVFMMATTELHKIPDTVLSRSQIYEFRTISPKTVVERLRFVATEEQITVSDDALLLLARAGEGSMRDSLSAFDQVRAFAGDTLTLDDVTSVLGLVGRDLVFDMLEAIAAEDAPAAFTLVDAAIERGYDLRLLCRELARATRDLLIVSVDGARLKDPDIASESERERFAVLGPRFSREDLLRTFDGFTKAEFDVRTSDHPRFQMEMALLRLMHLRKLVPLAELLEGGGRGLAAPTARPAAPPAARPAMPPP
ncbi:MAG: DNA polymerase III subunit gamma/tau, partial [Acidobacteria bacterium]|nr:DNA polymerase III subunit gamma/tau [Acidobacteriota bacterium]